MVLGPNHDIDCLEGLGILTVHRRVLTQILDSLKVFVADGTAPWRHICLTTSSAPRSRTPTCCYDRLRSYRKADERPCEFDVGVWQQFAVRVRLSDVRCAPKNRIFNDYVGVKFMDETDP